MQYWAKRKDLLNRLPSLGRLDSIKSFTSVLPSSREAILAIENDALKIDCLFLVEQTNQGSAVSGVGSTFGNLFRHDMIGGKTMFVASSPAARDIWIRNFQQKLEDSGLFDIDEVM